MTDFLSALRAIKNGRQAWYISDDGDRYELNIDAWGAEEFPSFGPLGQQVGVDMMLEKRFEVSK